MKRTIPLRRHSRPAAALALVLASASTAMAVEVRTIESPVHYSMTLKRAYAPCTAPNDVTGGGLPACAPPVTSACNVGTAHLQIQRDSLIMLDVFHSVSGESALCRNGDYHLEVRGRSTFEPPDDPACPSGFCTSPDVIDASPPFTLQGFSNHITTAAGVQLADQNFQILGVTLIAPDGLPVAGAVVAGAQPQTNYQNLSVGYPECTSPAPGDEACDAPPWESPCDFTSGTVAFPLLSLPSIVVNVHEISGTSPLCTNGTYQLATRARVTLDGCGPTHDLPCTLPDATYVAPIVVSTPEIQAATAFAGLNGSLITSAELLGFQLFDPTGKLFAAAATTPVDPLTKISVTFKDDHLRVRALLPLDPNVFFIDPANDEGATFTLHDRNGVIHTVTLPGPLWQLQPPLGERWEYKDKGGSRAGVRKVRIRLLKKRGVPLGYDVRLAADDVNLSGADLGAVTLDIRIGLREPFVGLQTAQATRACKLKGKKKLCE